MNISNKYQYKNGRQIGSLNNTFEKDRDRIASSIKSSNPYRFISENEIDNEFLNTTNRYENSDEESFRKKS